MTQTTSALPSVGLLSLGCVRNLVDSEIALGSLIEKGYPYEKEIANSDIAIVNTCGFTEDAKRESLETIFELCRKKKEGKISKVVVMGCLSQRYLSELSAEIKEADLILGTNSFTELPALLEKLAVSVKPAPESLRGVPTFLPSRLMPKHQLTPEYYSYIKINEGCINACAYCAIPSMKGRHRSRTVDDILQDALRAQEKGVKEINIIGQDIAAYGMDLFGELKLDLLLSELDSALENVWVRLLYAHPAHITDSLIKVLAGSKNIIPYIDVPIEHSHPDMLRRMNRGCTREQQDKVLFRLRKEIPNAILRTAVIVGFPGETPEEHQDLLDYMNLHKFERLGAFAYSHEENTKSYSMKDQVDEELKKQRLDEVMNLQAEITESWNLSRVGSSEKMLYEGYDEDLGHWWGRGVADAPDVDARIILQHDPKVNPGTFLDVKIIDSDVFDVTAKTA
ncbi:MAG: 30S ribosomal protein S12 methylthiotransferase RimO [Candidatus Omnitrophica bacterium]|nr:30S ribosomal protein S12 methylthiotransferase RimO [Candidatus Omnitrophota bacterium]